MQRNGEGKRESGTKNREEEWGTLERRLRQMRSGGMR